MKLFLKMIVLGGLSLFLIVLLACVGGLVSDRERRRDTVANEVGQSTANQQSVRGPMLVIPITHIQPGTPDTREHAGTPERRWRTFAYVMPKELAIVADATVEMRHRGIYQVPVYVTTQHMRGRFVVPADLEPLYGTDEVRASAVLETPKLTFSVSDPRGIRKVPTVKLNGQIHPVEPGDSARGTLVALAPPLTVGKEQEIAFTIDLELDGTTSLGWVTAADSSTVELKSNWKDPSFAGAQLPAERTVTANGFNAIWRSNQFSGGGALIGVVNTAAEVAQLPSQAPSLVQFAQPFDIYVQLDRAVKYGFLFICLTFAAFFLFEITKKLPIHPLQYGMVGLSLILFFLLLLSLSEHMPFGFAYAVASVACVLLNGTYLRHVLQSVRRGFGFGAILTGLYGSLFILLRAEEYALLLGSGMLFALLGSAMFLTRKIDWYGLNLSAPTGKDMPIGEPVPCAHVPPYR